ncbi:hypothetical protein BOO86_08955 [Mycobacterium sp. CBMA 234]|uniref:amidohydrolase family protein n=1 Tax=Mycolicibacterium sp. CBMA 234 TaxID=1918495 RepID=UPI0012DDD08C|nr:amidohydrolase family protein [Mycolicibacterium sp. CBMA 234]MUL64588.1 hypothetical protein [Mycolicibacterium sp. CBMA 234]
MIDLAGVVPGIIDTHLHQWDPFTTPREASKFAPLYKRAPRILGKVAPIILDQGIREFIVTLQHVASKYLPAEYARDVASTAGTVGVPVAAAVHIEAGWHGDPVEETRWLETLPFGQASAPRLAAIVGRADPRTADFERVLDAHAEASSRFRGIRFLTSWHEDPGVKRWNPDRGVLASSEFLKGFAALAQRGLTFDAYVYSTQLADIEVLAAEYPETTIVLDHYATPVGWLGPMGKNTGTSASARADIFERWKVALEAVAQHPNVVSKQSGIAFPMLGLKNAGVSRGELANRTAPMINHAVNVFGDRRIMFGSNFPVDKSIASYDTIVGVLADVLADRGEDVLRKVFHDNAIHIYRIDGV